ncbi:hypothetical protein [Gimesia fumaroli]|uniref:Uncharacterized protein n=1 Tax=Gimesia fumaroli TaxID=2527976 RepID=A0A518I8V8_9PLAN|nr:hypothetical protein [Gimesia fumaroli]QDV49546.1 hypothetical protein Enr17x_15660 [Gimesia fumaroli]
MEVTSSNSQLVKHNKELPEDKRSSHVLLKFAKPIRSSQTKEFFRIHLTPEMHTKGEEGFQTEILQGSRSQKGGLCKNCGQQMDRPAEAWCICRNDRCKNAGKRVYTGKPRGVIGVLIFPDFVCDVASETETLVNGNPFDVLRGKMTLQQFSQLPTYQVENKVEFVNQCLLQLDRRYPDSVLAGVYRAAGTICDMNHWTME